MAEAGTLCINADVLKEAGANANSTYTAEAYTNVYILEAEAQLCAAARYDFVTNYSSVSAIGKELLRDGAAAYAAYKTVKADMSGFSSRQEALVLINMLWASFQEVKRLLKEDDKYRDFVISGTGGND